MRYGERIIAIVLLAGSLLFAGWTYFGHTLRSDVAPGGNMDLRNFVLQTGMNDGTQGQMIDSLAGADGYSDASFYTDRDGAMTLVSAAGQSVFLRERTDGWDTEQISILRGDAAVQAQDGAACVASIWSAGTNPKPICSLDYSAEDGFCVYVADADGNWVDSMPLCMAAPGKRVHFTISVRRELLRVTVEDHSAEFWLPPSLAAASFSFTVGGENRPLSAAAHLQFYDLQLSHKRI